MFNLAKVKLTITISSDLLERIKENAELVGITPNSYCSFIVGQYIDNLKDYDLMYIKKVLPNNGNGQGDK